MTKKEWLGTSQKRLIMKEGHREFMIGVFRTSFKENEKRVPIYPEHLSWIKKELLKQCYFEKGYGLDYGYNESYIESYSAGVIERDELFNKCDILILPKPVISDLKKMKEGQILWGWAHCVQQIEFAQVLIDRKLTISAWEAMHHWDENGNRLMHIFYKNNEIAGYAAIIHVLQLLGVDGHYGPRRNVTIMGYGSVSRGAIYALQGRGFNNIHVYTARPTHLVRDQNPDVYYEQYFVGEDGRALVKSGDGKIMSLIDVLSEADLICNAILQDTDNPSMFVRKGELERLKPRSTIIDISCDEGIGFYFSKPTTFEEPTFKVGDNITYYSVDHIPSYLWNAASREISRAIIPYLEVIGKGINSWKSDNTIGRSIEIENGIVKNPKILRYQNRSSEYPYPQRDKT